MIPELGHFALIVALCIACVQAGRWTPLLALGGVLAVTDRRYRLARREQAQGAPAERGAVAQGAA
jgi:cytochrome c biogenesis factor